MIDNPYLNQMSIDIEKARENPSFSVNEMNALFLGDNLDLVEKIRPLVENDPLFDQSSLPFKNRQQQLVYALQVAKRSIEITEEHHLNKREHAALLLYIDVLTPLGLHYSAFMSVIETQGSPEQIDKWYNAADRHAIIGCYAQTELSHGSNVAGLKTVAVFDEKTDELVIHSPDLTVKI
ncbi:hypothetical protein G6F56_011667 [Rhizopus delemar]|nr:hypothetical protein G6F56_011667 [Rhizopus delemar]